MFCCVSQPCRADINVLPQGSRATGMGGVGVLNVDVFAAYNNQAALGFLQSPTAAVHYQNNYFSEALGLSAAVVALPISIAGVAAADVCSFGYSQYRETRIGIGLGKCILKRISIGTQLNYHLVQVAGYGNTGSITAELGLLAEPITNLWVGAHVFNFTVSRYFSKNYRDPLPVIFNLGMGYHVSDNARLLMSAKFESDKRAQLKVGGEVCVAKVLQIRLGVLVKPVELFAGLGYAYKRLQIDVAFSRHETLGYSPQISLGYTFTKTKKRSE